MGKSRKTQDLDQTIPAKAIVCNECKGSGFVRPMFYQQVCHACDGAGITNEDGSKLEVYQAFRILWRRMERMQRIIKKAGIDLNAKEPNRYAGASERLGGRFVMD